VQDRLRAEDITNYLPEANRVVGVALQPGRRIVFLALRDPYGPFIPRKLTTRHHRLRGRWLPRPCRWKAPSPKTGRRLGHVYQADGTPVPFANVRLFSRIECDAPSWVGIIPRYRRGGAFQWDFVLQPLLDRIVAVDPRRRVPRRSFQRNGTA
jgi:hypothetical protein